MFIVYPAEPLFTWVQVGLVTGSPSGGQPLCPELDAGVRGRQAANSEFGSEFEIVDLAPPEKEFVFAQPLSRGDFTGNCAIFHPPASCIAVPTRQSTAVEERLRRTFRGMKQEQSWDGEQKTKGKSWETHD